MLKVIIYLLLLNDNQPFYRSTQSLFVLLSIILLSVWVIPEYRQRYIQLQWRCSYYDVCIKPHTCANKCYVKPLYNIILMIIALFQHYYTHYDVTTPCSKYLEFIWRAIKISSITVSGLSIIPTSPLFIPPWSLICYWIQYAQAVICVPICMFCPPTQLLVVLLPAHPLNLSHCMCMHCPCDQPLAKTQNWCMGKRLQDTTISVIWISLSHEQRK